MTHFKQKITELKLIPSSGGCFELSINGELLYSKLQTGKFPDEKWALETAASHLRKA